MCHAWVGDPRGRLCMCCILQGCPMWLCHVWHHFPILCATCGKSLHAWHMECVFVMPCVVSHLYFLCHVWYEFPRVALTLTLFVSMVRCATRGVSYHAWHINSEFDAAWRVKPRVAHAPGWWGE